MCLDQDDTLKELIPTEKTILAWKVFRVSRRTRSLRSVHFDIGKISYNKWYTAAPKRTVHYTPNFHAFKTRAGARFYVKEYCHSACIRKVKLRFVNATGTQNGMPSIVAVQMLVLKSRG